MPTIHLVAGSTGAGKTTFSMRLADEQGALRLSIDEWMTALWEPPTAEEMAALNGAAHSA